MIWFIMFLPVVWAPLPIIPGFHVININGDKQLGCELYKLYYSIKCDDESVRIARLLTENVHRELERDGSPISWYIDVH